MSCQFNFRVKDLVNREEANNRLRAIKHKRKYFPRKVICSELHAT